MTASNRHLFVYGTLMGCASGRLGQSQRERLAREALSLGAATLRGALHNLGDYPGFVESGGGGIVHGEALMLAEPSATFPWLDAYEGIQVEASGASDYARREHEIRLASGETLSAWVYVYLGDTAGARRIESGRWET